jgi:outer membrane lipoprotein carrier protein
MFRLAWLAALSVAVFGADPSVNNLIQKVENRYNGAHTLSVHFREDYSIQGHPRPPEAGTLLLKKQGKMRWDYTQPQGKLLVSDGKAVFLYTARDNRVEKVPLKDTEDMRAPLAFLLGHLDMQRNFDNFSTRPGPGGTWLDASAKSSRVPYGRIQMLIEPDGAIHQLDVLNRDQSQLTFHFSAETLNTRLADTIFHFTIPPGAEVVDAIEAGAQGR